MKDIVVFAGSAVGSVLSILRQIKRTYPINAYVVCLNTTNSSIFNASKYVTESIDIFANTNFSLFQQFQNWFANKKFQQKPILYCTTDTSCIFVNKQREWFSANFELTIPSNEIITTYNTKGFAEIDAKIHGLKIPKSRKIEKQIDIQYILNNFIFPVIIKPTTAQAKKTIDFKTKIFHKKKAFEQFFNSNNQLLNNIICQEYIPGKDENVYYYLFYRNKKGELFENIGIKTLQSPPGAGIMAKGITKYNETISKTSRVFLEKINYNGIGGIEYKEFDGEYYFIEMSTRAEGFILISEMSNVPISKIAYHDLSGIPTEHKLKQIDKIKYIDLLAAFSASKKSKNIFRFLLETISAIFDRNTHVNILTLNDVKPFLIYTKRYLNESKKIFKRR